LNFIVVFVKILSVTSIVLAALWLLVPEGSSQQLFKYAMSLFVVAIIVSTFEVAFSSNSQEDFAPKNTSFVSDTVTEITASTTEYVIEQLLEQCNIKFKEVTVITDNSNGSDINITRAYVELQNSNDFERAAEIVKNQTGIILLS